MRGKSLTEKIAEFGDRLLVDAHAAWIAARDPRTPRLARLLALAVAAYALSPLDLVPDFIPILGWLDDLIIVPLGLWGVRKLIPDALWQTYHAEAVAARERPSSRAGMIAIIAVWAAALFLLYWIVRTAPTH